MGNDDVPGNAGLRDQVLALKWVNDHIAFFGGDPQTITIAGESAGGLSVALHVLSPKSQGLFQRAIIQSGGAICPFWRPISPEDSLKQGNLLVERLGCNDPNNVLECIQNKDLNDLVFENVTSEVAPWNAVPDVDFTSDPFLPGNVVDLLKNGQFNKSIQVIFGNNADEGILAVAQSTNGLTEWDSFRENFPANGPSLLFGITNKSEITSEDIDKTLKLADYYFNGIKNINKDHQQEVIDMFTDASFQYCAHETINYFVQWGMTVYQYILTHRGAYSLSNLFGVPAGTGVSHADDLIYLWKIEDLFGSTLGEKHQLLKNIKILRTHSEEKLTPHPNPF